MDKHIYLHTSKYDLIKDINEDSDFQRTHEYGAIDFSKLHKHEYGRIKTGSNFYHIILGHPRQEKCPWCGSIPEIREYHSPISAIIQYSKYRMECMQCGACGPIINVNPDIKYDSEIFYHTMDTMDILKQRYETRRAWDDGFLNQYE